MLNPTWPVLKRYDRDHLLHVALPLGGIGTGTVSLGGRGDLRDWEVVNRPAKGFVPVVHWAAGPFFALYVQAQETAAARALEGPLDPTLYQGAQGAAVPNHGLPRFRNCEFATAYPLGQVVLSDPSVPVEARIEAFNPLIPPDAERSGLPVAVLRFVLLNLTDQPMTVSVAGTLPNFIGLDGSATAPGPLDNRNVFRVGRGVRGLWMTSQGVARSAEQWGTLALVTTAVEGISYRTDWLRPHWGSSLLDFWDDFSADGRLEERPPSGEAMPIGSLAVSGHLPARGTWAVTYLLAWHFPNRMTWTPGRQEASPRGEAAEASWNPNCIGNYYTTRYVDAWDVAEQVAPQLTALEADTLAFVRAFCACDLPAVVKEAALFNLSTLRSQTCFRTPDGRFFGWEGCNDSQGCCHGSCTHVWNYEQATPFLFGELALRMREVEFGHATRPDGLMAFRVNLPLERAQEFGKAAADGQMGCIMKLYRDWQLSGDDELLRALWPFARQALAFCWIPGGWDTDRDGVMEGCQHNTMDVEYYGPNPQMESWYLGALRAAEEIASYLGEGEFAATCCELYERGRAWTDAHLFNGEYYEHQVRPPAAETEIPPGLVVGMGSADPSRPDYQLGPGCLVDQLVGQYMAHICGLGYLLDPGHVATALQSILRYNLRTGFHDHFNCMRSYALGDEAGLLMASYPRERPRNPFPYFSEVMTGFEYTAAVGALYEGLVEEGLRCIENIRYRYDGRKRNPFDEAECGHHYVRAMASWAAVLAMTGFHFSAVTKRMAFAAQEGSFFWSNGYAWGTCGIVASGEGYEVELAVGAGEVALQSFALKGVGEKRFEQVVRLRGGERLRFILPYPG